MCCVEVILGGGGGLSIILPCSSGRGQEKEHPAWDISRVQCAQGGRKLTQSNRELRGATGAAVSSSDEVQEVTGAAWTNCWGGRQVSTLLYGHRDVSTCCIAWFATRHVIILPLVFVGSLTTLYLLQIYQLGNNSVRRTSEGWDGSFRDVIRQLSQHFSGDSEETQEKLRITSAWPRVGRDTSDRLMWMLWN